MNNIFSPSEIDNILKILQRKVYNPSTDYFWNRTRILQRSEWLIPIIDHSNGDILDIGCGTCIFSFLMSKRYPEKKIVAVDITPFSRECYETIQKCFPIQNMSFLQGDMQSIEFPNNAEFGAIIINDALFYNQVSLRHVLENLSPRLQKNGVFIFDYWNQHFQERFSWIFEKKFPQYISYKKYYPREVHSLLEKYCLKNKQEIPLFSHQKIIRLIQKALRPIINESYVHLVVAEKK